jgi:hypothetical protein
MIANDYLMISPAIDILSRELTAAFYLVSSESSSFLATDNKS